MAVAAKLARRPSFRPLSTHRGSGRSGREGLVHRCSVRACALVQGERERDEKEKGDEIAERNRDWGQEGPTNISSADSDFGLELDEVPAGGCISGWCWSRKGLRETGRGRGGGSKGERGEVAIMSTPEGEAARLRKGLFEDRLRERLTGAAAESCPRIKTSNQRLIECMKHGKGPCEDRGLLATCPSPLDYKAARGGVSSRPRQSPSIQVPCLGG